MGLYEAARRAGGNDSIVAKDAPSTAKEDAAVKVKRRMVPVCFEEPMNEDTLGGINGLRDLQMRPIASHTI
jgi:hypothetical protein